MHILVTGGCGYTGTILTNDLIDLGHKVTVIENLYPKNLDLYGKYKLHF